MEGVEKRCGNGGALCALNRGVKKGVGGVEGVGDGGVCRRHGLLPWIRQEGWEMAWE